MKNRDIVEPNLTSSKGGFQITFGGPDEIDAKTLSIALGNIAESLENITIETDRDARAKLTITNTKTSKGSFALDLLVLVYSNPTLFFQQAKFAVNVLSIFLEILRLKKHLKGDPPSKIVKAKNQVNIENNDGESLVVQDSTFNLYFNIPSLDKNLNNIFNALERDQNRKDTQIIPYEKPDNSIFILRSEYRNLSAELYEKLPHDAVTKEQLLEKIILKVKKPDMLGDSRWEFYFNDLRIDAEIRDNEWRDKVKRGDVTFHAGTFLTVDMRVITDYPKETGQPTSKYYILKVLKSEEGEKLPELPQ
jgi:hypothetical protein